MFAKQNMSQESEEICITYVQPRSIVRKQKHGSKVIL